MRRYRTLGLVATAGAVAAYLAGVVVPYPGRAFSLTLAMLGVALVFVGGDPP